MILQRQGKKGKNSVGKDDAKDRRNEDSMENLALESVTDALAQRLWEREEARWEREEARWVRQERLWEEERNRSRIVSCTMVA